MDKHLPIEENARTDSAPCYRVWLCGSFRLERRVDDASAEVETKEWGGHSAPRAVLKALLCAPGRRASRGTLLAQLWPDATGEQAARDLNGAISRLRRILRDPSIPEAACLLSTEGDSLGFVLAGQQQLWLDADATLARLAEAERIGLHTLAALPLLEEACRLFQRGAFLESDEGEWCDGHHALVERRRSRCRLWLAQSYAQQGRLGDAEAMYADLLRDDPTDQWEAKMYLDLARHDQRQDYYKSARNILEQSTRIHAVSERCMIETVIYQTSAALGLHDLDDYASCLKVGASTAFQIGSQRRYQEALDLYQQVPKDWKQEPKIQNLAAFFQESNRQEKRYE